ncbi:MAG: DUF1203 domain-containing protein [Candidatus Acidiferrales bacterium]
MIPIRVVAIPTEIAESVRKTMKDPKYGFPAHRSVAAGDAPCRHCLQMISPGMQQTLFTYDSFDGVEKLPLPGPVYVHSEACERYPEDGGFPAGLRESPRTLNAYGRGRRLVAQEYVEGGNVDTTVERLLERADVDYIHVRSTTAGCYTFRVERKVED